MCQIAQEKTVQQQREEELLRRKDELYTQLTPLQSWNAEGAERLAAQNAHREKLISRQVAINQQVQENAQRNVDAADVNVRRDADDVPVQEEPAEKLSYKQRRERKRKLKAAQAINPRVTNASCEVSEPIKQLLADQFNSVAPYQKMIEENRNPEERLDGRVLRGFCLGYHKNALGFAATSEDRRRKKEDKKFLEDYISRDYARRRPYLEKFTQELIEYPLTRDTVTPAYIRKNAGELRRITDRAYYMNNIMDDPINRPFFDNMSPEDHAFLRAKMQLLGQVTNCMIQYGMTVNVRASTGDYGEEMGASEQDEEELQKQNQERLDLTTKEYNQGLSTTFDQCVAAVTDLVEGEAQAERNGILYPVKESLRVMREQEKDDPSIEFSQPAFREVYDQMRTIRELIASEPTVYRANRAMIDGLYQDAYRTLDLYNDIKMEEQLYLGVAGKFDAGGPLLDRAKKAAAVRKVEDRQKQFQAYTQRIDAITNALNFCLKEEALSSEARSVLDELGYTRQTEGLIRLRSILKKVQPGNAANGGNADAANGGNADAAPQE